VAVEYSGQSGKITHGDKKAYDACRYYGALIVAAVNGESRDGLLHKHFYENHKKWFGKIPLDPEIMNIAHGSYQRKEGYAGGIRGKGYIVSALEAALWAFWFHKNSFEDGALAAVNLGDDADTTAAIYGQLAGAYYGYRKLPKEWRQKVYAKQFIGCLSKWIVYEGEKWPQNKSAISPTHVVIDESASQVEDELPFEPKTHTTTYSAPEENKKHKSKLSTEEPDKESDSFSKFEKHTGMSSNDRPRRGSLKYNACQQPTTDRRGSVEHTESKQTTGKN
jgi:hypothetical protein